MVYTPTVWREMSMTTTEKLTALDNLEGMYSDAVSYIDSITHATCYYTDAQAAARYFTAANDGSGSLLVAETLDGYTSDQIISAGSPSGVIAWWSGSEASIPGGWLLCNGLNSTPDLRNRFVPGAGSHYAQGATGGANTVTTTGTVTIAGHSLTVAETPKHLHTILDYYNPADLFGMYLNSTYWVDFYVVHTATVPTASSGSGSSHSHTATWTGTASQEKRPPYYALCYIQKS